MSINFCTLTGSTLDTFCGNRRSIIVNQLLTEKYPPAPSAPGTNNHHVSTDFARRYPHLVQHVEHEEIKPLTFEQPFITVSAELLGDVGTQTLEAKVQMEFATVTDLKIGDSPAPQDISVNISDFSI